MTRQHHGVLIFVLAFMMAACGEGDRQAAGTSVDAAAEWTVEEEGRIGVAEDPPQILTTIGQILFGPRRQLIVSQPNERRIHVYDSTQALVTVIGREGQGPGEFGALASIGLLKDTLYALDPSARRLSFFSLSGELVQSRQFIAESFADGSIIYAPGRPQQLALRPDGTALVKPGFSVLGEVQDIRIPLLAVGPEGATSIIAWQRVGGGKPTELVSNGVRYRFGAAFIDSPLFEIAPDGREVVMVRRRAAPDGEASTFEVSSVGINGDTLFSRSLAYDPVPIPDGMIQRAMARVPVDPLVRHPAEEPDRPPPSAIERAQRDAGLIPNTLPPVTNVAVGQDGRIWLRREGAAEDSIIWSVLDRRGRPEATLSLPAEQLPYLRT